MLVVMLVPKHILETTQATIPVLIKVTMLVLLGILDLTLVLIKATMFFITLDMHMLHIQDTIVEHIQVITQDLKLIQVITPALTLDISQATT